VRRRVLIDTSAWILALRKGAREEHRAVVDRLIADGLAATTGPVVAELLGGTKTRREFGELAAGLSALPRLDPQPPIWDKVAEFAFQLRRKGISVPMVDVLIMTVAWENGCGLLHADRHFDLIAEGGVGLERVTIESLLV